MIHLPRSAWFFPGVLLCLVAASAGSARWMGYSQEENDAASALVATLAGDRQWAEGLAAGSTHHGLIPALARLPYALLAHLAGTGPDGGGRDVAAEAIFSVAPQVETALLLLVLAVWIGREVGDGRAGNRWALAALISTPLLPYAYIGMETTQSLLLFVTAFLSIGPCRLRPGWRAAALIVTAALTVSVKSQGYLLLPAVLFLLWRATTRDPAGQRAISRRVAASAAAVAIAARLGTSVVIAGWIARHRPGAVAFPGGAEPDNMVRSPFDALVHLAGFVMAPNKGLLWFAPLALWGLWLALQPGERDRERARFALLVAAALLGAFSWLVFWTDETWGPRYLHPLLAPAVLVLVLARIPRPRPVLLLALVVGGAINVLGAAVHYGTLYKTASRVEATTLGSFQFDPRWHHARFNAWVLASWLRGPTGIPPSHPFSNPAYGWMEGLPPEVAPRVVDLGELARPQPVALRVLVDGEFPALRPVAWTLVAMGIFGSVLVVVSCRRSRGGAGGSAAVVPIASPSAPS